VLAQQKLPKFHEKSGTVADLVVCYYLSSSFNSAGVVGRGKNRAILEAFREAHGKKRVAALQFQHIEAMLISKTKKSINAEGKAIGGPHAAASLRKQLRRLFAYAVKLKMIANNPVEEAESVPVPKGGFHTWTEEEIGQFRAYHLLGTKPRLALEIVLWTLQRRGDTVRFGPQHCRDGRIQIWQEKTQKEAWLPEPPQLTEAIVAMPAVGMTTFLVTTFGKPFTRAGFGNWFRRQCDAAGLPHCSLHGLRKATARRLAEDGASQQEIKAAGSWSSDKDVATYTAAADQRRMADTALTGLAARELANHSKRLAKSPV